MGKHGESFGSSGMCPHKRGFLQFRGLDWRGPLYTSSCMCASHFPYIGSPCTCMAINSGGVLLTDEMGSTVTVYKVTQHLNTEFSEEGVKQALKF